MELQELKKCLADRAEAVCRHLIPNGKQDGNEWVCGDLSGSTGKSLKIVIAGAKAGVWKDFAGDAGGSNLLELWLQVRGIQFQEAQTEARQWLGDAGVRSEKERLLAPRAYSKPDKTGVTWIANKAEFYLTATRQIPREIVKEFKVSMTEDETAIVFPYISEVDGQAQMLKWLKLERDEAGKKVTWTSKNTPKVLFGKHRVRPGDRYLLICEGETDAMTWAAAGIPGLCCVSVPFGAKWEGKDGKDPNSEWIENDWEFLSRFERIYLSMDMDEEGTKARNSIIKRLGRELCFVISLPTKDANEAWTGTGGKDVLTNAFGNAKTLDPETLKNAGEYRKEVMELLFRPDDVKRGIPLPFGNYPFHLRWHEWTVVTGMNGGGKSQLLGYIMLYLAKLGHPGAIASLEVKAAQTLAFYCLQTMGKKDLAREEAEFAMDWMSEGLWFYDLVGSTTVDKVLADFRYAYRRHGCRFFVVDSWMCLGISGEDLDAQSAVISKFMQFVNENEVHLFVVAHPRKQKDEEQAVGKMDVKGSGELTDKAHNVWTVWRNKKKEKAIERAIKFKEDELSIQAQRKAKPDTILYVEKQRNDEGDEPTIDLWFVKACKQFFGYFRETGRSLFENGKDDAAPQDSAALPGIGDDVPF